MMTRSRRLLAIAFTLQTSLSLSPISPAQTAPGPKPAPSKSPLSAAEEKAAFRLADPNLEIELVAAEPQVLSPVAMAWDAAGRLYVAEMIGYPATPDLGQIRLLEDRDGDGVYEQSTVFADRLAFPTSVMPFKKGVLVAISPDIVYMEDTDGDGKADVRRVEWTGFVPGVQQLRANALHWGPDNWIYGANGRSDYAARRPGAPESAAIPGRARDFRIHPLTGEFGTITGLSQFGLCHDDWGNRFLSWNTIPIRQALLEDRHLSDMTGPAPYAVLDLADPADPGRVFPMSPPPKQFNTEQSLYYNAMCGLTIYRGDALGPTYAGNAFVCESLTNLVTRRILKLDGPSFRTERAAGERDREFLASSDSWSHPVFLTTGPDGALYVADFYREFVEHPQYVADVKARASVDFRNGAEHGRIWRIRAKGAKLNPADRGPRLDRADGEELARAISHPVGWWRDTARRLLVERQDKSAVPRLKELVENAPLPQSRLQALQTLHGLGAADSDAIINALKDEDPRVRRAALNFAEDRLAASKPIRRVVLSMSDDRDPAVRFQLALVLKTLDTPAATDELAYMLKSGEDEWINRGVLVGSSRSPARLASALLGKPEWSKAEVRSRALFLERLGQAVGAKADLKVLAECLRGIMSTAGEDIGPLAFLSGFVRSTGGSDAIRKASAEPPVASILQGARKQAADPKAIAETRILAIQLLAGAKAPGVEKVLLALLGGSEPAAVQGAAATALARGNDPASCRAVYDRWQDYPSAVRRDILSASTESPASASALLDAVEGEKVPPVEVPQSVRDALTRLPRKEIADRAARLLAATAQANRQGVIDQYQSVLTLPGDAKRGAALFKEHCTVCHAMQGVGQRIGPDLAAVGSRRNDILLVDILDPSRQVSGDFLGYILATKEGKVISGIITAETAGNVTIRREGGAEETIPRDQIEQLQPTGKSLMPEGFEQKLKPQQFADILDFLRRPDPALLK